MASNLTGPSTSSLLSPGISLLADPPTTLVDAVLHDYFLIELVNTLRVSSAVATKRAKDREDEMIKAGLIPAVAQPSAPPQNVLSPPSKEGLGMVHGRGAAIERPDEAEEALRARLESMGMHVGANLAERLSRDRARFVDTLDTIKFICKDIWSAVWDKQVDNLRTNHRGVYVLQDNNFRPLTRISSPDGPADALRRAKIYVAFPAGVIRGALSRMGLQGTVVPEIPSLPQCTFQIKLPKT